MFNNDKPEKSDEMKEKYLNTIFLRRNPVTKKLYDLNAKNYFSNYGPFISKNKNIKILDIGSGMGHFLYALTKNGYKNFTGIDISSQMIKFCKKKVLETELKDTFQHVSDRVFKADAFQFLRANKEKFDLIVANDFIEHVQKARIVELFELIKQNLNNEGIFITKTANMVNLVSNMLLYDDFTHEVGFTHLSLMQVYLTCGFKNVKIRQFFARKPRMITRIFRRLTLKFISEIFGVKEMQNWSPLIFGVGVK